MTRFADCSDIGAPELLVVLDAGFWENAAMTCINHAEDIGGESLGKGVLFFPSPAAKLLFLLRWEG